jgi:hypothetical protein
VNRSLAPRCRSACGTLHTTLKTHPILSASILSVIPALCLFLSAPPKCFAVGDYPGTLPDCPIDPTQVQNFANFDTNRIVGNIARALARRAVYTDVLSGGTIGSGISDVQRSIVQERAVLNQSLVRPAFYNDTSMCGVLGDAAEVGSTSYDFSLQTNRGMGPLICVKGMRNAFEGSYTAAEDAMKKQIIHLVNSDIRATLVDRSGIKVVVQAGADFTTMFDGDSQKIDTPFPAVLPTGALNFTLLEYLGIYMREVLLVEGFEMNNAEPLLKFIGGQDIVNKLRDEADVRTDHRYIAAGSYNIGKDALLRYEWEGPYRGFAFGTDPQPLRYSSLVTQGDIDAVDNIYTQAMLGQPKFIEPEVRVNTTKGVASRVNVAWVRARYEVGILIGAQSFARLTPAQYTGEGGFRFPSQLSMGELFFQVIKDNCNNAWGDFGRHYYQIMRAYKPMRPHAVCPIAFARTPVSFNIDAVTSFGDWSSTTSI